MADFVGVVPALDQALKQRGYDQLTPVQEAVLAPELAAADLLVSAQTGSGKTVAFGLALAPTLLDEAETFSPADAPLALVVAPTRELALQVKRELEWLYAPTGASVVSCVGGMDMRTERRALQKGAHIVVGTPGRLRDHIERHSLNMSALKGAVLDEADEMLDLGFREDLEFILSAAPNDRRTLMFSATVPRTIATLAKRYQRDAVRLSTQAEQGQHGDIEYRALVVMPNDRENAIINVLRYFEAETALVFCATRATVNRMTARFTNRGFSVVALSGELSQAERSHALQAMRDGRARVCIATDVAARGIDLPKCELVIHADLPRNREGLLHRSGRTGRAGRKGVAVLVVPHNWRKRTERLLHSAGVEATWAKPPSIMEIMRRDDERLLADPDLSAPVPEEEAAFVGELLARHGAEQVAAAYVRKYRSGRSAPEELMETASPERNSESRPDRKTKRREDFTDGVWFTLSVGRKQNAEPRWLLPMLCKAGGVNNRDIGAIRIEQAETFVELAPGSVENFLAAIGPDATIEKTINVRRADGPPKGAKAPRDADERPARKPFKEPFKEPFKKSFNKPRGEERQHAPRTTLEPDRAPDKPPQKTPKKALEKAPKRAPEKASEKTHHEPQATKRPKNKKLKRAKKERLALVKSKNPAAKKSATKGPAAGRQGCGPVRRMRPKNKPA